MPPLRTPATVYSSRGQPTWCRNRASELRPGAAVPTELRSSTRVRVEQRRCRHEAGGVHGAREAWAENPEPPTRARTFWQPDHRNRANPRGSRGRRRDPRAGGIPRPLGSTGFNRRGGVSHRASTRRRGFVVVTKGLGSSCSQRRQWAQERSWISVSMQRLAVAHERAGGIVPG